MKEDTNKTLSFSTNSPGLEIETVEKKGIGHPDCIADSIAEELSGAICSFFLNKYGQIPRYNADLVSIIGGDVEFGFGSGKINKKVNIDLAGNIPYMDNGEIDEIHAIGEKKIYEYLSALLPFPAEDLFQINWRVNHYSTRNSAFFRGDNANNTALAEDTVVAHGFYPYTPLEQLTLDTNHYIRDLGIEYPIGSDTKIMALRRNVQKEVELIISIGFKALGLKDYDDYSETKRRVRSSIEHFASERIPADSNLSITVNAGDNAQLKKGYYLFSGTAAEHDKGLSGKGNPLSGVITPFRYNSFETVFGKNPIYHTGKIYNVLSFLLAKTISEEIKDRVETTILSRLGSPLSCPGAINVVTPTGLSSHQKAHVSDLIEQEMGRLFAGSDSYPHLKKISEEIIQRGNLTRFAV